MDAPEQLLPELDEDTVWKEYSFFREELRHESILVNHRVSWLISSQAFLLGGFATLLSAGTGPHGSLFARLQDILLYGLPLAGVFGVLANYVTIFAAVLHMWGVRRFLARRTPHDMPSLQHWHTLQLRMGLVGPIITPLIFMAFWIAILVRMR